MSILDRMIRNRHRDDAALAEIWAGSVASGEPAVDSHLRACAACRSRYESFCAWADSLRAEATAEADAAFPADRLAAQQAQIFRRLEALERPARVIAFPGFSQPVTSTPSIAYRWIAGAAAAGLVLGVALGQWMDLSHRFASDPSETTLITSASRPAEGRLQTVSAVTDEALLSDLEASAAMHPPVDPLRAIDTLTPRSRDLLEPSRK